MKKEEFTNFIEAFCMAQSLNINCSFVTNEKKDFYKIKLPKLLVVSTHITPVEVIVIMHVAGGLGSYATFDSFFKRLISDKYSWKKIDSHKYAITEMNFEKCIEFFTKHINYLVS
ncbi:hypothetical protein D3C81_737250 [compost metagenome]